MAGDALKLTCKVNKVTMNIKWKKNSASYIPRANIGPRLGDESTLYIKNVVPDDSGVYSCEAHNMAGTVSSTVKITVRGKPLNMSRLWTFWEQDNICVIWEMFKLNYFQTNFKNVLKFHFKVIRIQSWWKSLEKYPPIWARLNLNWFKIFNISLLSYFSACKLFAREESSIANWFN